MNISAGLELEIAKLIISEPYEESQVRFGRLLQVPESHSQSATFIDDSGERLKLSLRHTGDVWEPLRDGLSVSVNTSIGVGSVLIPALACRCEYGSEPVDGRGLHLERLFLSDHKLIDLCPFTGKLWQRLTPEHSPSVWECISEVDLAPPTLTIWRATLRVQHNASRDYLLSNSAVMSKRWLLEVLWSKDPLEIVYLRFYVDPHSTSEDVVWGWLWYISFPDLPTISVGMTLKGMLSNREIRIQHEEVCRITQWEEMFGWFRSYRIV